MRVHVCGSFGPDGVGRPGHVPERQGVSAELLATIDLGPEVEGITTDYGPGLGWPEDRNTRHWLESRGMVPAVEVSVDVVNED